MSSRLSIAADLSFLGLPQQKLQLLGACSAAAREHDPADREGQSDDHPNRGEVDETEHDAKEQRRSDDG